MGERPGAVEIMDVTPSFWNCRRVLVTGHTGFKGAWLSTWLEHLGAKVSGYALPPDTTPSLWSLIAARSNVQSIIADITDGDALAQALAETEPEIIFHLAAQSLVRRSYVEPERTFATNVVGIATLLKRVAATPSVQVVIIATSDKCYEVVELGKAFRESDPLGGHDPYSASKGCAEIAAASMRRSFFRPYAANGHAARVGTVRAGNVIGGGDWSPDRLIPDIVRGCLSEEARVVVRAPNSVRPWQHVLEPLRGYVMLAESLWEGPSDLDRGLNFGPGPEDERSVLEVANAMSGALARGRIDVVEDPDAPHETGVLRLDTTAARQKLGWRPLLDFERAIAMTASWYTNFDAGKHPMDLTLHQIESYIDRMRRG